MAKDKKLEKAEFLTTILNLTGVLILVRAYFLPEPYGFIIVVSIILPIISIVISAVFKEFINFDDDNERNPYPSIILGILLPSIVLGLKAVFDFYILDLTWAILLSGILSIVICVLLLLFNVLKIKRIQDSVYIYFFIFFIYSYGAIITTNCYYDNSMAIYTIAKVLKKEISIGSKSTSYRLELTPLGDIKDINSLSVSSNFYASKDVGDFVSIYRKKGKWGLAWYYIK